MALIVLFQLFTLLVCACLGQSSRFNCTDFNVPPLAKSVNFLHPGHISFMIAMGDSITAGMFVSVNFILLFIILFYFIIYCIYYLT